MTSVRVHRWLLVAASAAVCITALSAGCAGTGRESWEERRPDPALGDASDQEFLPCDGLRCSRDLKQVLHGCDDRVVEECGADKGCGGGKCVDACLSAELSKGSTGCSFWALPPDDRRYAVGSCFAAMIANTWDRPVAITAELGHETLDISSSVYVAKKIGEETVYQRLDGPLPVGEVALVFLSQAEPSPSATSFTKCPDGIVPAFKGDPIAHRTTRTRAFRLTTDAPVSAYSIFPYGGASSVVPTASLLLPVSAWGTSYVAVSSWAIKPGNPSLQLIANEDETEVRMRPTADISDGEGVVGVARGQVQTWRLSRGEVLQITQPEELSGSAIEADKPIGLFGGSECTFIPSTVRACDLTQQQIPPLANWGAEYALVPYRPRGVANENVPWRLVGAADGTVLTYDPARPGGAPMTLAAGEVATFMTDKLTVVRSQGLTHPFYAGVFMTGAEHNAGGSPGGAETLGDPEFVNVVPTEQFLDRYVFFVDYTFPESSLTVVRKRTANGFAPVELECAGELTDFRPLGTAGDYEYAWVQLTEGSAPKKFGSKRCGHGRHEMRSDGPFSVTVWGMGFYASYGYAGGMGIREINQLKTEVR